MPESLLNTGIFFERVFESFPVILLKATLKKAAVPVLKPVSNNISKVDRFCPPVIFSRFSPKNVDIAASAEQAAIGLVSNNKTPPAKPPIADPIYNYQLPSQSPVIAHEIISLIN